MSQTSLSVAELAALDELVSKADRTVTPGGAIAVRRRGRIVYRRGFGMASLEHGVANSPSTRFRIGSTSKQFTCLAVMLLAEEGLLDIDQTADHLIPELRIQPAPTLRQLMNHTGGLRCYLDLASLSGVQGMIPKGWPARAMFQQTEANFAPGQGQLYCNGGYHLLSIAIERASGMGFEAFLKARIFDPLGMDRTEGSQSDMVIAPGQATLHIAQADGSYRRGVFPTEEIRGEGNMVSTVDDLMTWLTHLNSDTKRVGAAKTWAEMLTPPDLPGGVKSIYAQGLYTHDYRGVRVIHHGGAVLGGACQLLTAPDHGLDVAILTNGGPVSPMATALKIIDVLLETELSEPPPRPALASDFAPLVGAHYHGPSGLSVHFADVGGNLGMGMFGSPAWPVLKEVDGALYAGFDDLALGPIRIPLKDLGLANGSTAPASLVVEETGRPCPLDLISGQFDGSRDVAEALVGAYLCADLSAGADISASEEGLLLTLHGAFGPRDYRLTPKSRIAAEAAPVDGSGGGSLVTLDWGGDQIEGFRLDSSRARAIRFLRQSRPGATVEGFR